MPSEVILRDVTGSDLPIFFEHQLDPDATEMATFPSRDKDTFMAHWTKIMADETVFVKTILFDGQVAGNIVSWRQSGKQEVGYWLGKEYWGKGIATKGLAAFLEQVNIRPLYAHVAKHNVGSRRVLEKCGFKVIAEDRFSNTSAESGEEFILKLG